MIRSQHRKRLPASLTRQLDAAIDRAAQHARARRSGPFIDTLRLPDGSRAFLLLTFERVGRHVTARVEIADTRGHRATRTLAVPIRGPHLAA